MTQEEKDLLLKDLSARLPYGVKGRVSCRDCNNRKCEFAATIDGKLYDRFAVAQELWFDNVTIKPFLFPLSSMTEEQKKELLELTGYEERCEESYGFDSYGVYINIVGEYDYENGQESIILHPDDKGIDWCNKNHFDYRGLLDKELAIDATGKNIY